MPKPKIILAWLDIETTGLDPASDRLLEIAWQATDYLGEPVGEIASYSIGGSPQSILAHALAAKPIVRQMHRDNGLWDELLFAEGLSTISTVRNEFLKWLRSLKAVAPDHEIRLAGSSVHFDKAFLDANGFETQRLSHRLHDLSTIRPIAGMLDLLPAEPPADPTRAHRALADVERDIDQWSSIVIGLGLDRSSNE